MAVTLNPYISFQNKAKAAMEFYRSVFGGELQLTTFGEGGMPHDPAEADHIMHGQLTAENGMVLMGADTPSGMEYKAGSAIAISLFGEDEATLRGYWDQLSADGTVQVPLDKAPWGDIFGMCADQFGIDWLVNITASADA